MHYVSKPKACLVSFVLLQFDPVTVTVTVTVTMTVTVTV
jgi:hypothetical protein